MHICRYAHTYRYVCMYVWGACQVVSYRPLTQGSLPSLLCYSLGPAQTLPVKFTVSGNTNPNGLIAGGAIKVTPVACDKGTATGSPLPAVPNPSPLVYDGSQFSLDFSLKALSLKSGCYSAALELTVCPGTVHSFYLSIK